MPITPLYEYYPVGFKTLQRYLGERGYDVRIINLSTVLLRFPELDFDQLLGALDTPIVGIDLHWMVHVQGSLAVAKRIREVRPDIRVVFGGISSTYYADELIRYPFVDMVMRGYDTHEPMLQLLSATKAGRPPEGIANLLWKDRAGTVKENEFSHKPAAYACGIDWSQQPREAQSSSSIPIFEISRRRTPAAPTTAGGAEARGKRFDGYSNVTATMARKPVEEISYEFETIRRIPGVSNYHFYSVGSYNESPQGMHRFLDHGRRVKS